MNLLKDIIIALLVCLAIEATAKVNHPSLIFTPERINQVKKLTQSDSLRSQAWESIRLRADDLLQKNDVRKMEYLALAFQMTGDSKYSSKIISMLKEVAQIPSWEDAEMMQRRPAWRSELQMAHRAFQLAVAFDAAYNQMTLSERLDIANGLWRLAGEPLLGDWLLDSTRIHSLNSMGHNWWTACVGMGGLLALAISNEVPQAQQAATLAAEHLPEWYDFAGDTIQHKPKTFDDNGGMYESINYANFGIYEALIFHMAWNNSHPDQKIEEIPQIAQVTDFFCNASYPRTGKLYSYGFGDSHVDRTGERPVILSWALGYENPNALWYLSQVAPHQQPEGLYMDDPIGFVYMPPLAKAPQKPALPLQKVWNDFGWATLRDSWDKDATMLAVKSGMTWNHAHADANSLILYHKGVDIIKDAGNCSYGQPQYRGYFFQSDAHNVVKFNGKGQSPYQQYHGTMLPGKLDGMVANDNIRYIMADGTGPMSDSFARNMRHFLWIDDVILVIDDIKSHDVGEYEWLWHPGGKAVKKKGDIEITKENSSVIIRPLFPQPLAPSGFVHDYPEMMYWDILQGPTEDLKGTEDYYSLKLPGKFDRIKGVTAVILKDNPDQKQVPSIEPIEGKDWIGVRINSKGKEYTVYINQLADGRTMHMNSWIYPESWETDAYMLVVSPEDQFICYGSALRKDGTTMYSSLSKLNVLTHRNNGKLDVKVTGQPRINLKLNSEKKPSSVKVNGSDYNPQYQNGQLSIKIKPTLYQEHSISNSSK